MPSFNFISPPSLIDQEHVTTHTVYHPGVALQYQQHIAVNQVHHPGVEIVHPAPFVPQLYLHHQSHAFYPQGPPLVHPGAIAMQNFAPGILQQNLARQPLRIAHILTYSTARMACGDAAAHALYEQALLATGLQPLITFDVGHFPASPPALAAHFTGESREIKDIVKQYEEGMRDLDEVVRLIMSAYDQGTGSLLLMVACPGGTHRSVAVGEIVRKKLLRKGVTTVHVTHVHRIRRPGHVL